MPGCQVLTSTTLDMYCTISTFTSSGSIYVWLVKPLSGRVESAAKVCPKFDTYFAEPWRLDNGVYTEDDDGLG